MIEWIPVDNKLPDAIHPEYVDVTNEQIQIYEQEFEDLFLKGDKSDWVEIDKDIVDAINAPTKYHTRSYDAEEVRDLLMGTRIRTEAGEVMSAGVLVYSWWTHLEENEEDSPYYKHYIDFDYEQIKYFRDILDVLVRKKEGKMNG